VVILNYNSKDLLQQTLDSVFDQDWPNLEVIVVDNCSIDGSPDMVQERFGDRANILRRTLNSPTAGRNQGFRAAKGDYVLSLDNDIALPDKSVIRKGIALFEQFQWASVLAFKIGTLENPTEPLPEHWWYPQPIETSKDVIFYTDFFSEGAVLFRSQALVATGGYDDDFFQGFESVELSLRLINDGFVMLYCPSLTCGEQRVRGFLTQKRTRINYLSVRNRLWIVWKHYPFWRGLFYASGRITIACLRSIRFGWIDHFVSGVKDGIFAPRDIRSKRRPLPRTTWDTIKQIRNSPNLATTVGPQTITAANPTLFLR
jgi:glycosyltransferase involved in cell wall biosynthesis